MKEPDNDSFCFTPSISDGLVFYMTMRYDVIMNENRQSQIFFGEKIRKEREKRGLSQEEFGKLAKAHRTYVGMIERGEKNITLQNMVKFARALGVQVRDLIDF